VLPFLPLVLLAACAPWRAAAEAGPRSITYVALGASDAVGVGARDPERDGWVARFYHQLPPGSSVANLGVSGSLLGQAIDQQLPVAVAARPDLVTVWLAVNDLNARVPLEKYSADLDRLLAALQGTGAKVLIGNIPDVAQLPVYRSLDPAFVRAQVDAWNGAIAEAATRHGALLVDLHATWPELADHPEYVASDGFHPSEEGYARLAELFWQALEANGGLQKVGGV
jgi:lysophospholipase L1-like esterase